MYIWWRAPYTRLVPVIAYYTLPLFYMKRYDWEEVINTGINKRYDQMQLNLYRFLMDSLTKMHKLKLL